MENTDDILSLKQLKEYQRKWKEHGYIPEHIVTILLRQLIAIKSK